MATLIKSLGYGALTEPHATPATLYSLAGGTTKSAIVKNIRFVNMSDTTPAEIKLSISALSQTKQITPNNGTAHISVLPKGMFVFDQEITLASGEAILGSTSASGQFDYIISGMEREQ